MMIIFVQQRLVFSMFCFPFLTRLPSKRGCRLPLVNHVKIVSDVNISVRCCCERLVFSKYACRVKKMDMDYGAWKNIFAL